MATEYCSTPARSLQLVLPPRGKPRTEPWAFRTGAPLDGERLNDNQRALLDALPLRATGQLPALRRLEARGLVAIEDRQRRRAPRTDVQPSAPVALTAGPGGGDRGGRGAAARICCTASPARARPRSTCAPPPRRSSAARA